MVPLKLKGLKWQFIPHYWLLLIGFFSFFRYSGIPNLFIPRKGGKAFNKTLLLSDFDMLGLSPSTLNNKIIIENGTHSTLHRMIFNLYPNEIVKKINPRELPNAIIKMKIEKSPLSGKVITENNLYIIEEIKK